ncbi:MAG: hypothetical protein QNJ87_08840 [Gammaproteobacteria bacterium]|nr:hypothetical protein [Gammaproteobacteria bacterium]
MRLNIYGRFSGLGPGKEVIRTGEADSCDVLLSLLVDGVDKVEELAERLHLSFGSPWNSPIRQDQRRFP